MSHLSQLPFRCHRVLTLVSLTQDATSGTLIIVNSSCKHRIKYWWWYQPFIYRTIYLYQVCCAGLYALCARFSLNEMLEVLRTADQSRLLKLEAHDKVNITYISKFTGRKKRRRKKKNNLRQMPTSNRSVNNLRLKMAKCVHLDGMEGR